MARGETLKDVRDSSHSVCASVEERSVLMQYCRNTFFSLFQMIGYVREEMKKTSISEQTMIGIVWTSVMSSVEWNKKEELVTEQAIKHLKVRDG